MGVLTGVAAIALIFYLTPLLRLISRPLRALLVTKKSPSSIRFFSLGVAIGRIEYLLGPLRDRLLSLALLGIAVYLWITEHPLSRETLLASSLIVAFNLLAILSIRYRDGVRLKLAELARCHSTVHPEDFFKLYYAMLSPWPPPFPYQGLREVSYNLADYRSGKAPQRSAWPLVETALATNTLARMAIMAFDRVGPEYGRDAFDGLARLWGSRIAQIFKARLQTTGTETLAPLEGKTLLLFNHKSFLDFGLNFFALGAIRTAQGRHLRPRFIAAKDHFIDNPFFYSWIGLGKVIENAGMIFINRQKGKGWAAMQEAAEKLVNSDVEIAVYPQGTRAYFMQSPSGERLDAGYYTTFSKKTWNQPLGHLKPGTAHLILDTLIQLHERGQNHLNILVVGIDGSAVAGPKGSFKIQTEAEITFRVAPVWKLSSALAEGVKRPLAEAQTSEEKLYLQRLQEIQEGINRQLLQATAWHALLLQRLQTELDKLGVARQETEEFLAMLRQAEAQSEAAPFILIDRIFSLRPELWERFFRLLLSLKAVPLKEGSWNALLQEVSDRLTQRG